jgi:hypothetical protein
LVVSNWPPLLALNLVWDPFSLLVQRPHSRDLVLQEVTEQADARVQPGYWAPVNLTLFFKLF